MTEEQRKWCFLLAKLIYPFDSERAGKSLAIYVPITKLPPEAFTPESAEAVVMAPRRLAIPSYDEVAKPLFAWWRDNRPARVAITYGAQSRPAIPAPSRRGGPTDDERDAVTETVQSIVADLSAKSGRARPDVKPAYLTGEALRQFRERAKMGARS